MPIQIISSVGTCVPCPPSAGAHEIEDEEERKMKENYIITIH